ncbi:outer membrane beta-barrel protein [Nitrogeniibacter mangrovi]|uniref:Outer membrane beta-barrel protein n=1 Tax=Nitrogeniibacter mangrovi TaxID=2016596 RepID=A0A6C1AYJ1_9RHOO|nr:outer membrane beta-barrel protein [Nitrogeniibacter mangrovi]QID16431.1 outer membrane beta-barrel protein [Nitrogeniibacter mangrovi]
MLLASLFAIATPVFAQSTDDGLTRTEASRETADRDAEGELKARTGLPWGNFRVYPSITLTHGLDSNLYGEARGETRSWVTTLTPAIEARSQWARHGLDLSAGADLTSYPAHSAENTDDYWLKAAGHVDLTDTGQLLGQAYARRDHEERGSPESTSGETPTIYDTHGVVLGVNQRLGDVTLRLGLVHETLDFDTPTGILGTNDDRDRTLDSIGMRASYAVATGLSVFAQVTTDTRHYDETEDDNGYRRDSDGHRVTVGASGGTGRVRWEAFAGEIQQDYDDARLQDVHRPYAGAVVRWQAASATRITGRFSQSLNETTLAGASSYFTSNVSAKLEHALDAHWLITGALAYGRSDYQGIDLTNRTLRGDLGVRYYLNDDWFAGASYRYLHRGSTLAAYEYFDDLLYVSVGYAPRQRQLRWPGTPTTLSSAFVPATAGGLYLGVSAGAMSAATSTFGARDTGASINTDDGDFAGSGATGGLFAGYGIALSGWQVALEATAERGDTAWSHAHVDTPLGAEDRIFGVRSGDTGGVALRVGHDMSGGLIYGRLGLVWTDFASHYVNAAATPAANVEQDTTRRGLRFGVGTEVPLGRHAFIRSEYAYTDYDGFHVFDGQNPQTFSPATSAFTLGLGWRFGGGDPATAPATPAPASPEGFYAGVGARQAMLATDLHAIHGTDNSVLDATFGNQSTALDLFAGIDTTFGRLYVGAEIDLATSDFGWAHDRVVSGPGGRDFSLDRKGSYGAGLRLGYRLTPGAMIYGRIGEERAKFDARYARGNATPVQFAEYRHGTRLGLGTEMALGTRGFFRIEYSEIDFGTFRFIAPPQANGDQVRYEAHESRVDMAWGVRF